MTIYDFVNSITDCWNIVFTLFDCNTQDNVMVNTDEGEKTYLTSDDLLDSKYADYEIGGTDIWIDGLQIRIEFNIDIDEEDFDDAEV